MASTRRNAGGSIGPSVLWRYLDLTWTRDAATWRQPFSPLIPNFFPCDKTPMTRNPPVQVDVCVNFEDINTKRCSISEILQARRWDGSPTPKTFCLQQKSLPEKQRQHHSFADHFLSRNVKNPKYAPHCQSFLNSLCFFLSYAYVYKIFMLCKTSTHFIM